MDHFTNCVLVILLNILNSRFTLHDCLLSLNSLSNPFLLLLCQGSNISRTQKTSQSFSPESLVLLRSKTCYIPDRVNGANSLPNSRLLPFITNNCSYSSLEVI